MNQPRHDRAAATDDQDAPPARSRPTPPQASSHIVNPAPPELMQRLSQMNPRSPGFDLALGELFAQAEHRREPTNTKAAYVVQPLPQKRDTNPTHIDNLVDLLATAGLLARDELRLDSPTEWDHPTLLAECNPWSTQEMEIGRAHV